MIDWSWQHLDWPNFNYRAEALVELEKHFLQNAGYLSGAFKHVTISDQEQLKIDLVSEEAVETSAIEGEILNRDSVQASLRRDFGFSDSQSKIPASEQGISALMVDLYNNFAQPLSHDVLFDWHLKLMNHRVDLTSIGNYRQHNDPMQIISGTANHLRIHYEAPPSQKVLYEMERFINWFNTKKDLPILIKAGIAHLYFELIHPFEDGNGRIGRAIVEKAISQGLQQPLLLSLSRIIQKNKKEYYAALAAQNNDLHITNWLIYFANTMLAAQEYTKAYIEFLIAKTKLFDRIKGQLNMRQEKVIARMFKEGIDGFSGGLSAENYISITQISRATATRDLQDLILRQVLFSVGERKSTRYFLNL